MVRVSVEGIKNGLYVNTVAQTKTFDMNTEAAMFWHKFKGQPCPLCPHCPSCDIDGNGRVDMGDINYSLDNFGKHYP